MDSHVVNFLGNLKRQHRLLQPRPPPPLLLLGLRMAPTPRYIPPPPHPHKPPNQPPLSSRSIPPTPLRPALTHRPQPRRPNNLVRRQ